MRLLITRPAGQVQAAAEALRARGHEVLACPLIAVQRTGEPKPSLTATQAFIVTDADGARALANAVGVRTFPVFCESAGTAAELNRLGFKDARSADGDATTLARLIEKNLTPKLGGLVYVCSTSAPVNLSAMLSNMGFAVRMAALYAVTRADALPAALAEALKNGALDGAAFFSADEARAFVQLVQKANLDALTENMIAVVAAPVIAAPLTVLKFKRVVTAPRSDAETLIGFIDDTLIPPPPPPEPEPIPEPEPVVVVEEPPREPEPVALVHEEPVAEEMPPQPETTAEPEISSEPITEEIIVEEKIKEPVSVPSAEEPPAETTESVAPSKPPLLSRFTALMARFKKPDREEPAQPETSEAIATEVAAEETLIPETSAPEPETAVMAPPREPEPVAPEPEPEPEITAEAPAPVQEEPASPSESTEYVVAEDASIEVDLPPVPEEPIVAEETLATPELAPRESLLKKFSAFLAHRRTLRAEAKIVSEPSQFESPPAEEPRAEKPADIPTPIPEPEPELPPPPVVMAEPEPEAVHEPEVVEATLEPEPDIVAPEPPAADAAEEPAPAIEETPPTPNIGFWARLFDRTKPDEPPAQQEEALTVEQPASPEEDVSVSDSLPHEEPAPVEPEPIVTPEPEPIPEPEPEPVAVLQDLPEPKQEREDAPPPADEEPAAAKPTFWTKAKSLFGRAKDESTPPIIETAAEPEISPANEPEPTITEEPVAEVRVPAAPEPETPAESPRPEEAPTPEPAPIPEPEPEPIVITAAEPEPIPAPEPEPEPEPPTHPEPVETAAETEISTESILEEKSPTEESALGTMPPAAEPAPERPKPSMAETLVRLENELRQETVAPPMTPDDQPRDNTDETTPPPARTESMRATRGRSARLMAEDAADARALHQRTKTPGTESSPDSDAVAPDVAAAAIGSRSGSVGKFLSFMVVLAVAAGAIFYTAPQWAPSLRDILQPVTPETAAPLAESGDLTALKTRDDALSTEIAALKTRLAALEQRPAATAPDAAALTALTQRIVALEGKIAEAKTEDASQAMANQARQLASVTARVATLEAAIGNVAKLEDLGTRLTALEGKSAEANSVLALGERVASLEKRDAVAATALVLATAQLREAVSMGRPYAIELETVKQLAARAGVNFDDAALKENAAKGMVRADALTKQFAEAAQTIVRASALPDNTAGWFRRMLDRVYSIVSLRPFGAVDGDSPGAVAARAEQALRADNLPQAVTELETLNGPAADAAKPWLNLASARVAAIKSLDGLAAASVGAMGANERTQTPPPEKSAP